MIASSQESNIDKLNLYRSSSELKLKLKSSTDNISSEITQANLPRHMSNASIMNSRLISLSFISIAITRSDAPTHASTSLKTVELDENSTVVSILTSAEHQKGTSQSSISLDKAETDVSQKLETTSALDIKRHTRKATIAQTIQRYLSIQVEDFNYTGLYRTEDHQIPYLTKSIHKDATVPDISQRVSSHNKASMRLVSTTALIMRNINTNELWLSSASDLKFLRNSTERKTRK